MAWQTFTFPITTPAVAVSFAIAEMHAPADEMFSLFIVALANSYDTNNLG